MFSMTNSRVQTKSQSAVIQDWVCRRELSRPVSWTVSHGRHVHVYVLHCKGKVKGKGKSKASSLDIAPPTILDSGALQPRKRQPTGIDCSIAAQASGCP